MLENYHIPMNQITNIIAMHYKMERSTIKSSSREGHIVKARNFCIYFLHKYLTHKVALESTKHNLVNSLDISKKVSPKPNRLTFS